jgi:hypothetical protein
MVFFFQATLMPSTRERIRTLRCELSLPLKDGAITDPQIPCYLRYGLPAALDEPDGLLFEFFGVHFLDFSHDSISPLSLVYPHPWRLYRIGASLKGVHQALLVHRLNEAIKMGCTLVSAETRAETKDAPNPSYHNLQRLGFQLAYLRLHYHFDPALLGETHPG